MWIESSRCSVHNMKIAVIGDNILDFYVHGTVDRISPESPIPIFRERHYTQCAGGSGNVVANLKAFGVDVTHHRSSVVNSVKKRYVCDNHILFRTDIEEYVVNDQTEFDLSGIEYCIISDYNKGFLHHSQRIVDFCKQSGCKVVVDPKKHLSNYTGADYIKLNEKELKQYTDGESWQDLLRIYGFKGIVVTLGAGGVEIYSREYIGRIESDVRQVSDVTGAGDVFVASMTYFLARGLDLETACRKANSLAGLSVTKFGTYVLTPDDVSKCRTVFTNGCFDILHRGHIELLESSKALGSKLIVGLNSDESIKRLKGDSRPINNQDDRKAVLKSLGCVDEVIVFDEDTPYDLIKQLKPDIITKGSDYAVSTVVGNDLAEVVILPLVDGLSTTKVIERIR